MLQVREVPSAFTAAKNASFGVPAAKELSLAGLRQSLVLSGRLAQASGQCLDQAGAMTTGLFDTAQHWFTHELDSDLAVTTLLSLPHR